MRMTVPLQRVLRAFLKDPAAPRYGYDLMKAAGLPSGTLYPMLARLEDQKLVTSAWETPQAGGERPRRYYQLTGEGIRVARLELAQVRVGQVRAPVRLGRAVPGSLR
jgi:PadR family transcriptional regulator, regulatory protein PadR